MASDHPKRDVTVALNTVQAMLPYYHRGMFRYTLTPTQRDRLIRILTDIDARTGRKDPHLRRKPARKR